MTVLNIEKGYKIHKIINKAGEKILRVDTCVGKDEKKPWEDKWETYCYATVPEGQIDITEEDKEELKKVCEELEAKGFVRCSLGWGEPDKW